MSTANPIYDNVRYHAAQLLADLGDTPEQVAATLHAAGIRGQRCNGAACPIAEYLLRSDLGLFNATVNATIIGLRFGEDGLFTGYVDAPDAVERFIDRFDEGAYDELLAATR